MNRVAVDKEENYYLNMCSYTMKELAILTHLQRLQDQQMAPRNMFLVH